MRYYNINTDQILTTNDGWITTATGRINTVKMTTQELENIGYFEFVIPPETENTDTNRLIASPIVLIDGTYTMTYIYEDIPQDELDEIEYNKALVISNSMTKEGALLTARDDARVSVGAGQLVENRVAHDAWMIQVYANYDANEVVAHKPPAADRQLLTIESEDRDSYTFTRYQDEWGYRWRMGLFKEDTTNLAVAIYDQDGNYLYTTGKLLPDGEGKWFTECPAGQADASPENVYYKWLLGSGDISGLQVYEGADDTISGIVRSDERYD